MKMWKAIAVATALVASGGQGMAADLIQEPIVDSVAEPEARVKIGVLTCESGGGFGYIIGSAKDLECTFENANGNQGTETYRGQIVKVGADVGYTDGGALVWAVFAPSYEVPDGRLDGTYVGVSAEATAGIGIGANVLFGSFNSSYNLVPLSLSGDIGLNVAGGLGAITLASN